MSVTSEQPTPEVTPKRKRGCLTCFGRAGLVFLVLAVIASIIHLWRPLSDRALVDVCQSSVLGMRSLTSNLEFPEDWENQLWLTSPGKPGDFDVNSYFSVLDRLSIQPGYQLDFIFYFDQPWIYARLESQESFTLEGYIQSIGGNPDQRFPSGILEHVQDYLSYIQIEDSPSGYLQFAILETIGRQFYLYWHANYNDRRVLCSHADIARIKQEVREFSYRSETPFALTLAQIVNISPTVKIKDEIAEVSLVVFSKWGGVIELQITISRDFPHKILGESERLLIPYYSSIGF